jgi:hypothetical protein
MVVLLWTYGNRLLRHCQLFSNGNPLAFVSYLKVVNKNGTS